MLERSSFWYVPGSKLLMLDPWISWIETIQKTTRSFKLLLHTVDGSEIPYQLRLVVEIPVIYKVLYIPDGAGFLPSTVLQLAGPCCPFLPSMFSFLSFLLLYISLAYLCTTKHMMFFVLEDMVLTMGLLFSQTYWRACNSYHGPRLKPKWKPIVVETLQEANDTNDCTAKIMITPYSAFFIGNNSNGVYIHCI